jgi:hypothetical protein
MVRRQRVVETVAPKLFQGWRAGWRLRRGTGLYVAAVCAEPDEQDVQWLAGVATAGDVDRARWELRYARRALGLLVAERDALDDRTGSVVARQLSEALRVDRNVAAGMVRLAERQLNERLAAYRETLQARAAGEGTAERLGRTLLVSAQGDRAGIEDAVPRAGGILASYLAAANQSLRQAFGEAALPEDRPPSELIRDRVR